MTKTYGEIKRQTLELINQFTMAGTEIASSYNNQADYLKRIPAFINSALTNIATLVKKIPTIYELEDGEEYGDMTRYALPADFYCLKTGGVSVISEGEFRRTNKYMLQGKQYLLVPKSEKGSYTVEYYRYPDYLSADPEDDESIEVDPEVIDAARYYAAANMVGMEDEFAYSTLYNDYESRLARISPGIQTETLPVDDAYGFGNCGGDLS